MDSVLADRLQFAFTIMFHYLFPIGTMGLAPFVAWYTWKASSGDADASRASRFWTKIFTINFAAGVVTGIPMEFQFGTNWATFAQRSGSIVGQPLAMEGMFAFFLESVFLGVLLYRARAATPSRFVAWSAIAVCAGSWLSGFFIVVTDAWMQHPVGYHAGANGLLELDNIWAVLLSPFAGWQYAHVLTGALVAGGFIVAGIGSYYLLSGRETALGRRFVRDGAIVALIFSLLAVFPTGDRNGADVTNYQPIKLAAMEGLFETINGAPLAIIGMPDTKNHALIDPVYVPNVLSFLAYGNFTANVKGLSAYAEELHPPVALVYYAYHVMVGLGTMFAAAAGLAVLLLWRKKLFDARPMLWILMLLMPFPYIANEAGWTVTEVGRQPWIVYGVMRTAEAGSPNVAAGETIFTLVGFAGMYFILGVLFLYLVLREIAEGPGAGPSTSRPSGATLRMTSEG
ncbi:MAG TPA: cytochrome ubiquinol oxidase subunit I [Candidatus Baltobacteraceae bacterium]|nr:cytochrome ubiquinol oxidase subunit I [Candidatus Baltobacteraceae bacterium]